MKVFISTGVAAALICIITSGLADCDFCRFPWTYGQLFNNWLFWTGQAVAWVLVFWAFKYMAFQYNFARWFFDFVLELCLIDLFHVAFYNPSVFYLTKINYILCALVILLVKVLLSYKWKWFKEQKII